MHFFVQTLHESFRTELNLGSPLSAGLATTGKVKKLGASSPSRNPEE